MHEDSQFSPQMVLVVLRILNSNLVLFMIGKSAFTLFTVFSFWIGPGLIFESPS
jgi:hypothetical protein